MERCGFFDAYLEGDEYDRVYLSQHFAAYFASFIANGVYAERSNQLQVMSMATPQMQISVESGQGWINGYWYENTDSLYLPIDIADGVLNRIDSVVLRLGLAERNMWLALKKGTPAINPVAPPVTRNADYYELQLATISIPASSIRITQAQITDTRMDQDVCGWVTGVVQQLDTTTLFEQFEAYFSEFKAGNEQEFRDWFDEMKDQLSEDAAGHLQLEIDELDDAKFDKANLSTTQINSDTKAPASSVVYAMNESFAAAASVVYAAIEEIRTSLSNIWQYKTASRAIGYGANVTLRRYGPLVIISGIPKYTQAPAGGGAWISLDEKIPAGYRPASQCNFFFDRTLGGAGGVLYEFSSNGGIRIQANSIGADYFNAFAVWFTNDAMPN